MKGLEKNVSIAHFCITIFFAWIVSFNVWFSFYQFLKLLIRLRHHHLTYLTHYYPVLFFYTPWKHQVMFSGGIENKNRTVMG